MENAELPCDVVSNPKKLVFHWSFNNSADGTPLTSFTTNGSRYLYLPRKVNFLHSLKDTLGKIQLFYPEITKNLMIEKCEFCEK